MAIETVGLVFAKPEPKARQKARRQRAERDVIVTVRRHVASRDGYCRLYLRGNVWAKFGRCRGRSEWAHLGVKRRARTVGQQPQHRHMSGWSLMLCTGHHYVYDAHEINIMPLTKAGADGRLRFTRGAATYEEPE